MSTTIEYGHLLSPKSTDLRRDTFIFLTMNGRSHLSLGFNQKLTPVTPAVVERWVNIMAGEFGPETVFLGPVTMESAGVMAYFARSSGPVIHSSATLTPGNYGWFLDTECTINGAPKINMVRERLYSLAARFSQSWPEDDRSIIDIMSPAVRLSVAARDQGCCRVTGSLNNNHLIWIIPPVVSWETDNFGDDQSWDSSGFQVAANVITMEQTLTDHFLDNHFAIDVDDNYRILVFRAIGDALPLPSHLPNRITCDKATDEFLRVHFRYTLSLMLRGGDISDVYSNTGILDTMDELGITNVDDDESFIPLTDLRWGTVLGKSILDNLRHGHGSRTASEESKSSKDSKSWGESSSQSGGSSE
ncbi:hypothetical protein B0H13DRAFT_2069222 [Mycena leptocephala]|nr:hypothetical protein B0H13DRAFT_2069222 [Mycena leptocephala]